MPRTSQISLYPTRETAFADFSCGSSNKKRSRNGGYYEKRRIEKKKIIVPAICICAVLCGTTVFALVQSDEKIMGGKLARIDKYEKQAEELMEEDANTADADKRHQLKEELDTVLEEKIKLEMETASYDYKGELEISINSVLTAVEDSERFLKEDPERSSKKRKNVFLH